MQDNVSLRDIYNAVNDLRKEVNDKVEKIEGRVNLVESKTENLLGKIGIGVMVVSAIISCAIAAIFDKFKEKL